MPVTFDNINSTGTSGTKLTMTLTVTANASVVLAGFAGNGQISVSAAAFGGVAMTRLKEVQTVGGWVGSMWALSAPPTGVQVLSAEFALTLSWGAICASYIGSKTVNGLGTAVGQSAQATATPGNLSVSSTNTDLVVAFWSNDSGGGQTLNVNAGTVRLSRTTTGVVRMLWLDQVGAPTVSLSASGNSTNTWAYCAVPLVFSAVAAAGGLSSWKSLTGVGR